MTTSTSFYRKILVQEFEEKIHRVDFCLSHGSKLIQEIDTQTADMDMTEDDQIELDNTISEAKAFIFTGHDNMGELKEIYQELKDHKYQCSQDHLWIEPTHPKETALSRLYEETITSPLPALEDLILEFEEKIHQAKACLFHAKERVQQLGDLIQGKTTQDSKVKAIEINSFMYAGYEEMQQLRDLYQTLKEKKEADYNQLSHTDPTFLETLKEMLHA